MSTSPILNRAAAVVLALCAAMAFAWPAAAQSVRIQKVANKALSGSAYARLRNLTYDQCEERCLKDKRCVALEYRRESRGRQSFNCALFSTIRAARDSKFSDIGYKRTTFAYAPPPPTKKKAFDGNNFGERRSTGGSGGAVTTSPAPSAPSIGGSFDIDARRREAEARREAEVRRLRQEMERRREQELARRTAEAAARQRSALERAAPTARAPDVAARSVLPEPASPPVARSATRAPASAPAPEAKRDVDRSIAPVAPPAASRGVAAAPPPEATVAPKAAAKPDYHVVPVYYGTDRNRKDTRKRIGYGNDRARRLELGQALVTVPSEHKVPNIERPSAWRIPYFGTVIWQEAEDPKRHFTIQELKALSKTELLDLVRKRLAASSSFKDQALVFIHGYNVGFDDSLYRTAQISYDLQFDGAAFTYSWPSGSGWTSYPYDRDSAQQAEPYLYEFLQMVQNETGTKSINIIAHSMGNQILLQVLRDLKRRSPAVSKINQIVLAAPDVDRDAFEFLAAEIKGIAKGITLYAASNDKALDASRIFAGNRPRAGDVPPPPAGPVVVAGIDTIDITGISTSYLSLNHNGYAEHTDLLSDLGKLIRTGQRPPDLRIKKYERITGESGIYWRYGQ